MPYKDQKSADAVCRQLCDLGVKINQQLQPVFISKKIADHLRVYFTNSNVICVIQVILVTLAATFISQLTNINIP